ncbi:MAG TPA: glycogen synthase GlgA [Rhizomicrobium sp.]|nr:glycogen synthase GlgA [Rhizomicrobium sp.]
MQVLFVTSEAYPLAKSGGLADVSSALPAALSRAGIDVRILMPAYPGAADALKNARIAARLPQMLEIDNSSLIAGELPHSGVPVWLVDAPALFDRHGGLYQDDAGHDWADNARRFAFLAHAAAHVARGIAGWKPDVVHANDWHAGLVPLLLAKRAGPASVFTIHNLAFQGNFPADALQAIGIPGDVFHSDGLEFYGQASFLKAALRFSDKITTVSPTYAAEALGPDAGCGLEGILRSRAGDFSGILNGIDTDFWNPATDIHLPANYSAGKLSGKRLCKAELQREFALPLAPETPLIGFVSRIAHQKMADVILDAIPAIVDCGAQFVLLGRGDPALEAGFAAMARRFPENVAVRIGYDEPLAHRLQAGADILLAPARFEPCGLTQLYALRYGTIPIVRKTGGLADTVKDASPDALADRSATGFVFEHADRSGLLYAVGRALQLYKEPLTWRRIMAQAMAQDFSWTASAAKYAALYFELCGVSTLEMTKDRSKAEPDALLSVSVGI